jgi:predicted metal-dependent hydrolase
MKKYMHETLPGIAEKYNLKYNKLSVTSAKTRWGSCSSKKNINFTYRLIMAPKLSVDYVIIHELANLVHMNHSLDFWSYVDRIFYGVYNEDYNIHQNWLKKN